MKMTTEVMLARFEAAHGATYDYSQAEYTCGHNPVTIVCRAHGPFQVSMYNHAAGHGCSKCAGIDRGLRRRVPSQHRAELILARLPYPDKYDLTEMLNAGYVPASRIPITCKLHGRFVASYSNLLNGKGCPECGGRARGRYTSTYEVAPQARVAQARVDKHGPIFLERARATHGDAYDYSKVVYKGMRTKVDIVCEKHGVFSQTPMKHVSQRQGCPSCANRVSRGETEIAEYLRSLGVVVEASNRTVLKRPSGPCLELDIYLPELRVGIEHHGTYWHADDRHNAHSLREKWELANAAGIRLIQIFDDEWLTRRSAVEGLLRSATRKAGSLGARRLEPAAVSPGVARAFLDRHHLQGFLGAKRHFGLFLGLELYAVASFGASRFEAGTTELIRYASKCNIAGGLRKLIKHAGFTKLTSYCDMRHGTGSAYAKSGFVNVGITPADYWWFKGVKRYARYECQKHRLKTHLDFVNAYADDRTEKQICETAGFRKISGVGHLKFVYAE